MFFKSKNLAINVSINSHLKQREEQLSEKGGEESEDTGSLSLPFSAREQGSKVFSDEKIGLLQLHNVTNMGRCLTI